MPATPATPRRIAAPVRSIALPARAPLAAALLLSITCAHAAPDASADASAQELDAVEVQGTRIERASSPKYTAPLRDTPQVVTTVDSEQIEQQNLFSLQDVLATLPGITFGAGEGGGGFGDKINLRGFDATSDITVDGVRDSGLYSRNDPFNLDTIEVINGANSVYSGAGSIGGTVNLVSKMAGANAFNRASVGLGTDDYARVTTDSNFVIGERAALRLNTMAHAADVPGRDFEREERWGIAPSLSLGLGSDTTWTLNLVHQQDENIPVYGVPYYNGAPVPGVDDSTYYGYRNLDGQDIDASSATSILTHAFSDTLRLRNLTRWQQVDQLSLVSATQGSFCLANGLTPLGVACPRNQPGNAVQPAGTYLPSGPRGYGRDTRNTTLYNQTDLTFEFATGPVAHTLVAGASVLHETFDLDVTSDPRNVDGTAATLPLMDVYDPSGVYTGPVDRTLTGRTEGELDNQALYVFDTLKFSERWLLSLGARYERNAGSTQTAIVSTTATPSAPIGTVTGYSLPADNEDRLFSYRAGVVYKPVEAVSLYAAYANSKTPSKASVNGSCTASGTPALGTANCGLDPESAVNTELGAKWDLMGGRLSLTGSLFRNEREDYRVSDPGNPDNPNGEQQLDGRARVDGLLLGVSGLVRPNWSVFANYAHLRTEVLQGVSDRQAGLGLDYTRGDRLLNVPENSFSVWTTYDLSPRWQFGVGSTYQGRFWLTQHSATNPDGALVTTDSYWVHRAMASYKFNRHAALQLNVNNLTDARYFTNIRNNGWATPGEARSVVLTANFTF